MEEMARLISMICTKRGALWAYQEEDFVLTTARDPVSTYPWRGYQIKYHHLHHLWPRHMVALARLGSTSKAPSAWKLRGKGECLAA
jgi:hypothetical protein